MGLFGGTSYKSPIADRMRQPRQDALDMTYYLLGFNPYQQQGAPSQGGGQGTGQRGAASQPGGANPLQQQFGVPGGQSWGGGQGVAPFTGQGANAWGVTTGNMPQFGGQNVENFFGGLISPLQQQAIDASSKFFNQQSPQQRTMDELFKMFQGAPGSQIMDALQPHYQQNLAAAHSTGDRFSSGNAVREAQAANDYNLLGAQAAQQDIQNRLQAAQQIPMLQQSLEQSYANAAALGDTAKARQIQIMLQMLNTLQGATFGIQRQAVSEPGVLNQLGGFAANAAGAATGLGWQPFASPTA